MKGGQVVELIAFFVGMAWVIGFTIAKVTGRETRGWKWMILQPLVWFIIALGLVIIQQYIMPRRHRHPH